MMKKQSTILFSAIMILLFVFAGCQSAPAETIARMDPDAQAQRYEDTVSELLSMAEELPGYRSYTNGNAVENGWYDALHELCKALGVDMGGAGVSGVEHYGVTVILQGDYCSAELCRLYSAVLFAIMPDLDEISIGNEAGLDTLEPGEEPSADAVGLYVSREAAQKEIALLTNPLAEYGETADGLRELIGIMSGSSSETQAQEPLLDSYAAESHQWQETFTAGNAFSVTVDEVIEANTTAPYTVYEYENIEFSGELASRVMNAVIGSETKIIDRPSHEIGWPHGAYLHEDSRGKKWRVTVGDRYMTIALSENRSRLIQKESTVMAGDAYPGEPKGTTLDNVKISYEDAKKIADNALSSIGIDNLGISSYEKARVISGLGDSVPTHTVVSEGWYFEYHHNDGNRQPYKLSDGQSVMYNIPSNEIMDYDRLPNETVRLYIDENGIQRFTWDNPSIFTGNILSVNPALSFEQLEEKVKTGFDEVSKQFPDVSSPCYVKDISLVNCPVIAEKDAKKQYLIPTWVVECIFAENYDPSINYAKNYLCFNAIDGTPIDHFHISEPGQRIAREFEQGMQAYYDTPAGQGTTANTFEFLLSKADELASYRNAITLNENWNIGSARLVNAMDLILRGGSFRAKEKQFRYTVEVPSLYNSNELCFMYAAVMFAIAPDLAQVDIGNKDYVDYHQHIGEEEYQHLLSTAVGRSITRDDAEKHWTGLTKPFEEYGSSGSGIRELLSAIAKLSGVDINGKNNPIDALSNMDLLTYAALEKGNGTYALPRTLSGNGLSTSIWDNILLTVNDRYFDRKPYDAAGAAYNVVDVRRNEDETIDVYLIITYQQYSIKNDELVPDVELNGSVIWHYKENENGEIEVVGVTWPKKGSTKKDWPEDLQKYTDFSSDSIGRAERLKAIDAQIAISMDNNEKVDALLSTIVSSPKDSSAPIGYIHEHVGEYGQLCAMGRRAVSRFLPRFESGRETGLEGQIIAMVFNALTGVDSVYNYENGQAWYDANREEILASEWVDTLSLT